jgi:hypothetical protein
VNGGIGDRKQQRAVLRFHLDQRAARHEARVAAGGQHVLRLDLDLTIAAAACGDRVDELALRLPFAVRVDVADVLGQQRVQRRAVALDHRTETVTLEAADRLNGFCRHLSSPLASRNRCAGASSEVVLQI